MTNRSGGKIVLLSVLFFFVFISAAVFGLGFFQNTFGANISLSQQDFVHTLRTQVIQQLIENKFDRFIILPLGRGNDFIHITGAMIYPEYPDYFMTTGIVLKDDLDLLLVEKMKNLSVGQYFAYQFPAPASSDGAGFFSDSFVLSEEEIQSLKKVYLFKSEQDLKDLGYVVSSYRTRINTDESWRADNISISFWNIGNIRVINPGQEISFMDEIHYDPNINNGKRDLAYGRANVGGMRMVKGGGICAGSRAINALILPNKSFEILERKNHTYNFTNLYNNTINGQESRIPGLDVAVYSLPGSKKDFRFKNIREYPVVMIMNYDGAPGGMEEMFVLSKEEDSGELTFLGRSGNCFSRDANGNVFKSCYGMVTGKGPYKSL